jgi:hypothetical protein
VELLNFIFRLGVVFAIFGFLWGVILLGYNLLRTGNEKSFLEEYLIKMMKYFILVDVTFIFGFENELNINQLITTSLILLTYFVGKLQNKQTKTMVFKMVSNGLQQKEVKFDIKAEIAVISMSITIFIGFIYFPQYAENSISKWFHESIINIEDTPIFGFIFKVIGFVFIINLFSKMINGFSQIISGKPILQRNNQFKKNDDSEENNKFDEFEELD